MVTKFVRICAALFVGLALFGTAGSVRASGGDAPQHGPRLAPVDQPFYQPALSIPPASSLGVQFVLIASVSNTIGTGVKIDHPLTNNHPNAIIIVTPNWDPGNMGGTYDNHPLGVFYDGSSWWVTHQDLANMVVGSSFNVLIPTSGTGVFVHTAAGVGPTGSTEIDNALTNNNPNARILVTSNYNPGGGAAVLNNHSIGVWYYEPDGKWTIINQDGAAMPFGAAFDVFVLPSYAGSFIQTSSLSNISGDGMRIDNPLTNNRPNTLVFITPNRSPAGVGGVGYTKNYGVWTDGSHWFIFNQDLAAMPANVSFNVLVLLPAQDVFVQQATATNTTSNYSYLDNALTNGHPNAIVFTTPNFNPNGLGGMYNIHNTGVFYGLSTNQWAIFNQDMAGLTLNNAFNVVIPNPDTNVYVHKTTAGNISSQFTFLDNPLINGDPNAVIIVTPNWNPGGLTGVYENHPIGVFYSSGIWNVFNEDNAAMPVGASFNVFIPPAGSNVFVHTATFSNSGGNVTRIDNPLTNMNPRAILLVTPNLNPGDRAFGVYDNHPIGVYYDGSKWAIFNQDIADILIGSSFNVYVSTFSKVFLPMIER